MFSDRIDVICLATCKLVLGGRLRIRGGSAGLIIFQPVHHYQARIILAAGTVQQTGQ
jgi:hypothetical protein